MGEIENDKGGEVKIGEERKWLEPENANFSN